MSRCPRPSSFMYTFRTDPRGSVGLLVVCACVQRRGASFFLTLPSGVLTSATLKHMGDLLITVPFASFTPSYRGKRQMLREWNREWGSLDKEGNIWWIGGRRSEWEAVMGKNVFGWICRCRIRAFSFLPF